MKLTAGMYKVVFVVIPVIRSDLPGVAVDDVQLLQGSCEVQGRRKLSTVYGFNLEC